MTLSRRTAMAETAAGINDMPSRSASRRASVKALLFAFGPLLLLTALGLIGARVASFDTREAASNGKVDWETRAFVGDQHVREDKYRPHD